MTPIITTSFQHNNFTEIRGILNLQCNCKAMRFPALIFLEFEVPLVIVSEQVKFCFVI